MRTNTKRHEKEHFRAMNTMTMVRWVCHVMPDENVDIETLLTQLNIRCITDIIRTGRLRWLGHVELSTDWISKVLNLSVFGKKKTWQNKNFLGQFRSM